VRVCLGISIGFPPFLKISQWRKCLTVPPEMIQVCMSSPVSYDLQGQGGGVVLNGGDTATNVRWVQCLTNCVFTTFTASNLTNSSDIATITIPAGVGIGGKIETVTLTSGLAIAYSK
jgi:hypothetical protein